MNLPYLLAFHVNCLAGFLNRQHRQQYPRSKTCMHLCWFFLTKNTLFSHGANSQKLKEKCLISRICFNIIQKHISSWKTDKSHHQNNSNQSRRDWRDSLSGWCSTRTRGFFAKKHRFEFWSLRSWQQCEGRIHIIHVRLDIFTHIWLISMINVGKYTIHRMFNIDCLGSNLKTQQPGTLPSARPRLCWGNLHKTQRLFESEVTSKISLPYLEDHPRTRKWWITMVIVSPLSRVVPHPNGHSWDINRGY